MNLIKNLPQLQHDEKNPNDCATEPHSITHITHALRYFCVSQTQPTKIEKSIFKEFGFEEEKSKYDYGESLVVV